MIKASGNTTLVVIEANAETPLVKSAHGDGHELAHVHLVHERDRSRPS